MVTSTRAIVNTARSMVSTIMKFLDSGPNKAVDSTLKTRILASEPDNAEGIHNFAPLGKKRIIKSYWCGFIQFISSYEAKIAVDVSWSYYSNTNYKQVILKVVVFETFC